MDDKEIPQEPKEKIALQVIITKEGSIRVEGLIQDEILALGLLEKAKGEIVKHHMIKNAPKIVKPQGSFMQNLRNGLKK